MASLELRLTRLETAFGRRDEVPVGIALVGADGIARGPGGVAVDPATVQVLLYRGEPAPPRLVAADPPPPHEDD